MRRFLIPGLAAFTLSTGLAAAQTAPSATAPVPGLLADGQAKFAAANTTHDGHLTLAQAQTAGLKSIAANFTAIDTKNRGYVTFNDILAWRLDQRAQKMEQKAEALRASD